MTRAGDAFELPTSVPPTGGSGSSSLLPTPAAQEPGGTVERYRERLAAHDGRDSSFVPLGMIGSLLPTPSANDHTGGEGQTRTDRQADGTTGGPMLRDVAHLLPTPLTSDQYGRRVTGPDTQLRNVRQLSGEPTSPPSPAGNTPPEPERPGQLTIEDA